MSQSDLPQLKILWLRKSITDTWFGRDNGRPRETQSPTVPRETQSPAVAKPDAPLRGRQIRVWFQDADK